MPYVYADAMILNPRVKLSIFKKESGGDEDTNDYKKALKGRFHKGYFNIEAADDMNNDSTDSRVFTGAAVPGSFYNNNNDDYL